MLVDIYVSTKEQTIKLSVSIAENTVCLKISSFMFSFCLSFMMDLYNLIPLTASAKITGINIMFCNNIEEKIKPVPFFNPSVAIIAEILYPKRKSPKANYSIKCKYSNYCKSRKPQK